MESHSYGDLALFRHRFYHTKTLAEIDPVILLWTLRILVPLGGHREFVQPHGFNNDALAEALGLGEWIDPQDDEFDQKQVLSKLRALHRQAEKRAPKTSIPTCLENNAQQLAMLVGLGDTDRRILEFAVLINNDRLLDDTADWLGQLSSAKVFHALSTILDIPEAHIRSALDTHAILSQSGLVSVDRHGIGSLRCKLELLSDIFADLMASANADPIGLLRGTVSSAGPSELTLDQYPHIRSSLNILRPYLRHVTATAQRGVNVFLYGAPGTGKSQLARVLADELKCELFEVASEDADGDPINGERRLQAFRAAQSFFAQRRALMVFDEVEDVFNDGDLFGGRKSTAQTRKGWINHTLEGNPIPTLWVSNSIAGLDPAFTRRFDMVFELPVPPKAQRIEILRTSCGDLLEDTRITHIAESTALAPAVVARASAVVRSIRKDLGKAQAGAALEQLISNTLTAQGHPPPTTKRANALPDVYDAKLIHADADLVSITRGIIRSKAGRLCLYGPPGTGKTAFGRWLAQQMGVEILVRRASDLISPWVGQSEKNIALAFREAEQNRALLLIDEVDSFLQDRRSAGHSWEVTLVNEMLTQMELFSGVFIASTNLMNYLDQAALRRFDLKVKFDYLQAEQAWTLLRRYCTRMGVSAPSRNLRPRMERMQQLTPGDFAAVSRQSKFRPISSATQLVVALEAECSIKESGKAPIGFI